MADFCPITSFFPLRGSNKILKWYCPPERCEHQDSGDCGSHKVRDGWWKIQNDHLLLLAPPAKKDFWRKTYYEPLLVKDDGPFLYSTINKNHLPVTIETSFSLTPKSQFDQAGILIRIDADHWIKTGIEVVDDTPRLSCVVTNSFSDWSTQNWTEPRARFRVHILPQHEGSFVVEAAPFGSTSPEHWSFLRIAHLNENTRNSLLDDHPTVQNSHRGEGAPPGSLMVGIFAACPVEQAGMVATFHSLSIAQGSSFVHNA